MNKSRLEAFSDGVIAIIITIMVLEMKVPHGAHGFEDLVNVLPVFVSYVLSFISVGTVWNNHHHMMHASRRVNGAVLWANLHLLFWLSLVPFVTGWMGENHFAPAPTASYGVVFLFTAISYWMLQSRLVSCGGNDSVLGIATQGGIKQILSPVMYAAAIPLALFHPRFAVGVYASVLLIWFIPDKRIERAISEHEGGTPTQG